jgi:hypothetical protein
VRYSNQLTDFDNEYVWHCHILGHEEQDFMRPFVFHPNIIVPDAPAAVKVIGTTVSWTDTTPVGGQDAQGIPTAGTNAAYPAPISSPKNEIGFDVYNGAALVATLPANVTQWTNASVSAANTYTVVAWNAAGASLPGSTATTTAATTTVTPPTPPAATPGTAAVTGATIDALGTTVTVASTAGMVVGASVSGGGFPPGTTIKAITSATTFTTSAASTTPGATLQNLTVSLLAAAALPTAAASAAPTGLTQTLNASGTVTLAWTPVPGATSYTVSITETPAAVPPALVGVALPAVLTTIAIVAPATAPAATYTTPAALKSGSTYAFAVTATTLAGTTVALASSLTNSPTLPPVAFGIATDTSIVVNSGAITLSWANNALNKNNVAGLVLTWTNGPVGGKVFAPTTTGATVTGLTSGTTYSFTLGATSNVAAFNSTLVPVAPAVVSAIAP